MRKLRQQIVLAGLIAASLCTAAQATTSARATSFEKWSKSAQRAFDRGLYKQSERLWARALAVAAESKVTDNALAVVLKRLGETLLKEGRYEDAQRCFRHAMLIDEQIAVEDSELAGDQSMLDQTYKRVDLAQLGKFAQDLLAQAGLTSMGIVKTDNGSRVQLEFPESFSKTIDNQDVQGVGVDRCVSFDIEQEPDGVVKISHIKGFRVHAKYWVNIVESKFKLAADGIHEVDITAEKMGITKTVHAKLNGDEYAPLSGLLAQMSWTSDVATLDGANLSKVSDSNTGSAAADTGAATSAAGSAAAGAGSSAVATPASGSASTAAGTASAPAAGTASTPAAGAHSNTSGTACTPASVPAVSSDSTAGTDSSSGKASSSNDARQPGTGTSTPGIESSSNTKNEIGQPRSIP